MTKKYEIITGADPDFKKSNRWFRECERNLQPFIRINKKVKYYRLHWDFISMTDGQHHFYPDDEFYKNIRGIIHKYWTLKGAEMIWGSVGTLTKLTLEQAEAAAVEIFDTLAGVPLLSKDEYSRRLER